MDIETFTTICLTKKGVTQSFPFGGDTLVFKVMGKMFALTGLDSVPATANLKCDPEWANELREIYEDIQPGFHMNKAHWNTVTLEGRVEDNLVRKLIDHSYELVVVSLPKKEKELLALL
ncbi:MAG: MmcQ/YjbR family DNA-binding protein [Saprospiraceae bacterium]|nr:MmcQ/YjbR family DNA-binding protein [Saprospiraceae bacterium]